MIIKNDNNKKNRLLTGFTIVELLVVVAVIVFMTGVLLLNWRSGERTLALSRVVHKAGQDVRRVQELALRAQAHNCAVGSISAYGIFFNQSTPGSYLLFAECNSTNAYESGVGGDDVVDTIQLEAGVMIQGVSPGSTVSIVFVPPTPRVFLNPGSPTSVQIFFQREDGTGTLKTLDVNSKGVIDID